ncbi:MAG: hypothetical protein GXP55_25935, partial [Deltaproteobacteria bacterium]|nr:hypothetical protein [Deltaproteobacteria bacterium]
MSDRVAILGLGQMGGVFARAFLATDREIAPILRSTEPAVARERLLRAAELLVAVGEADLEAALESLPEQVRGRVGLLQNELLPPD